MSYESTSVVEMIKKELGEDFSPSKLEEIAILDTQFCNAHISLIQGAENGDFDGRTFANKFNQEVINYFGKINQIIGPENYIQVFKEEFDPNFKLADPEIAAKIDYTKLK